MHNNTPNKSSLKTYIIVGVILVAAVIAYFYWQGTGSSSGTAALGQVNADEQSAGVKVFSLLSEINSLRIDSSLFDDPGYRTLRDFTVAVPALPVGRSNPFAPVPGVPAPTSPN